jgi:D-amino-acid dehydrogenase
VYPVKGYSVTVPVRSEEATLKVSSLTDDERKIVLSRIGNRLRIAGIAELSGYNTDIDPARCEAMLHRAGELFPGVGKQGQAQYWAGLRPSTPGNVPLIGRTRYRNLYLNTGHGTLGWTLACGSGRALADLLNAKIPEVDFRFLGSGIETTTRHAAK